MLYFLIALAALFIFAYVNLRKKVTSHFPATFPTAAFRQSLDSTKPTIVCFGDSNTHGNVSYDWVADLAKKYTDYQFVNAGRNSDLTFTLLRRMENIIACKPDVINLLIGTNDINATLAESALKRYRRTNKIGANEHPSIATFEANYRQIIHRLKTETSAKISVMSLPLMGEDLANQPNAEVMKYNTIIRDISTTFGLTYLPLFENQQYFLEQHPSQPKFDFSRYFMLLTSSIFQHYYLNKSWDEITKTHGNQLSPDFLHQNAVSGKMIVQLMTSFIEENRMK